MLYVTGAVEFHAILLSVHSWFHQNPLDIHLLHLEGEPFQSPDGKVLPWFDFFRHLPPLIRIGIIGVGAPILLTMSVD